MAAAMSTYNNIVIKKTLFSTKAVYKPTGSPVKAMVLEYSPSEGERVSRLLNMPFDKMVADIEQNGKPVAGANGNFRLEVCISSDRQFCALQMFRYGDFCYNAIGEPRFYEGDDAKTIAQIL